MPNSNNYLSHFHGVVFQLLSLEDDLKVLPDLSLALSICRGDVGDDHGDVGGGDGHQLLVGGVVALAAAVLLVQVEPFQIVLHRIARRISK